MKRWNETSITHFFALFYSLLNWIFLSLSQTLAGMSEHCSPLLEGCQKNRQHWKRLAEECEKGPVNGLVWSGTLWVRLMQSHSLKASVNQHDALKDKWRALFMTKDSEINRSVWWFNHDIKLCTLTGKVLVCANKQFNKCCTLRITTFATVSVHLWLILLMIQPLSLLQWPNLQVLMKTFDLKCTYYLESISGAFQ